MHRVHGELVVKAEPLAAMADLDGAALVFQPAGLGWMVARGGGRPRQVDRVEGIPRQDVLDVHEEELLMLLLVMEAQDDQLGQTGLIRMLEQWRHGSVDMGAVARDVLDARPREEPALGAGVPGADSLVVRVEDVRVRIVEHVVTAGVLSEQERLEEPRDMGAVPLRRADVGHRLDGLVLRAQDGCQTFGQGAHPAVVLQEFRRRSSTALLHLFRPFATPPGAVAHWMRGCGSPYPGVPRIRRDPPTFRAKATRPGASGGACQPVP